jgi:HK97 family phage major capsid protein
MSVNLNELNTVIREANSLSSKPVLSKREERRLSTLMMFASAIKSGASLQELELDQHNEESRSQGLPTMSIKRSGLTHDQETEARGWQAFVSHALLPGRSSQEQRDMVEGAPMINQIGTYSGLGYFVPTSFYQGLFAAMKAADFLFDPDSVTFIKTQNGRPLPVPVAADTENVATLISEAGSQTSTDIYSTDHALLGAYSYSSPRFVLSMEAFDDLDSSLSAVSLFRKFAADRIARGVGNHLVTGNGSNKPLGLVPALQALGVPVITAQGSAGNTGGAETGANSLGTVDFASAFEALDASYLASDKVAFAMNLKTLGKLMSTLDKNGRPIIDFVDGARSILGVPIKICPSLDDIGASKTPVILGDFSYWATRYVFDDNSGIAVYREAPGLAEKGNVGLRVFARADGALLYKDNSAPSPFVPIQNFS